MNYLYFDNDLLYPSDSEGYSPSVSYAEYPFESLLAPKKNCVYDAVRSMLHDMMLDAPNYGNNNWNPLKKWIRPGMSVCLKPNFVMHANGSNQPDDLDSLVTHPSVIRCILDYCFIALEGKGTVIVGDAPVKDCNFDLLMRRHGYLDIVKFYQEHTSKDFQVKFCDFRGPEEEGGQYQDYGNGVLVDLKDKSWFYMSGCDERKYRIPNYNYKKVIQHHHGEKQEYLINSAVLNADVVISIPKPKTHRKNGYTAALKNFVGINYSKEYLPHHTEGSVESGGDEYIHGEFLASLSSCLRRYIDINRIKINSLIKGKHQSIDLKSARFLSKVLWRLYANIFSLDMRMMEYKKASKAERAREGSWYGNDTLWRTVLDLNYALRYADKKGKIMSTPQRTILHFGDMVVSGEKEGPMAPTPKLQHMLLFSDDVVDFDCIVTKIMGFDYKKFKGLVKAVGFIPLTEHQYSDILISSNDNRCRGRLDKIDFRIVSSPFVAGQGWIGHVEID